MLIFTVPGFFMIGARINDYLHYVKYEKRYASHTFISYKNDLEQFAAYLASGFSIDEQERTINRKISALNSFYKYLLRNQHIAKNPLRQLHALRVPQRLPAYLKENETQYLLEEIDFGEGFKGATDRLICELLYQAGLRRAELIGLKEKDIEWSLGQLRIMGKGHKERLVPAGTELLDLIRAYIAEKQQQGFVNEQLLVLESGQPLYEGYVYRTVKKYLQTATTLGKKSPHVLRHTFATHLLSNGANIQAIKDLLGHSSLAATQVYTHNNIDQLKEIHKQNHPRG
jgi:integrase/recombinase XerC